MLISVQGVSWLAVGVRNVEKSDWFCLSVGVEFEFRAICLLDSTVTIALETC
jgi:hypothetical protein